MRDSFSPTFQKKVTLIEIAKEAGVSMSTVSRVLNNTGPVKEATVKKVLDASKQLGYSTDAPAQKKNIAGIIMICLSSIENPFYHDIVKGIKASAVQYGYETLINEGYLNAGTLRSLQNKIKLNHAVGVCTCSLVDETVLRTLNNMVPVIQCCEYNQNVDMPYVTVDDIKAGKKAVEYLLSRGRRRIALLNGPEDTKYSAHRLLGYKQALEENGLPFDESMVISVPNVQYNLGISAALHLLKAHNPPDAIFAVSDVYSVSAVRAASLCGLRVPQDLAVVGIDNTQISSAIVPSITTISMPRIQLGYVACEMLKKLITSPGTPVGHVELETELIVREST